MKKLQGLFRGYCFQQMKSGNCSSTKCKTCCVQNAFNKIYGGIIATDIIKEFDPEDFKTALECHCCKQLKTFKCNNRDCTYCVVNEVINLLSSFKQKAQ
jgi:hypothetical protein